MTRRRAALLLLAWPILIAVATPMLELKAEPLAAAGDARLTPLGFADLDGWAPDDHAAAWIPFRRSCQAVRKAAATRVPSRRSCALRSRSSSTPPETSDTTTTTATTVAQLPLLIGPKQTPRPRASPGRVAS